MSSSALASIRTPPVSVSAELTQRSLISINTLRVEEEREMGGYVFLPILVGERVLGGGW